ncbi:sugar porter family MFS transporter [Paraburkholderia edwinii]|uniref:Sugar porter family MFS transporter n=1 Tax=Paraburkholderia edwinii TaxID=2861782 RepID=A0ABX8UGZ4_9BURK|nr:sugar porter family MFS transporter [Paraburkholderia edwinii]QYD68114.1 sugar porter family MFS transporter [Paraburkholderia edwinii]
MTTIAKPPATKSPAARASVISSLGSNPYGVFVCLMAALAGLLFGLDIGVISGALPFIAKQFMLNDHVQEWIVSSMMVGAAIGAIGAGWLAWHIGRRYALGLAAVLFVIGSLWSGFAGNPDHLIAARLVLGLAVGVASFTAPLYLSEVAPRQVRGAMISTYQLMITVGILAAFLSNIGLSYVADWRWMLGVIAIPAVLFLLGVIALPDSPRWLMARGRMPEAQAVLQRLYDDPADVEAEIREVTEQNAQPKQGWGLLRVNSNFRRSVALGAVLQIFQQLTGINVVMYYAPRIFGLAGFATHEQQLWATVVVGLVNVIATFGAIAFVDRWGRKPILYAGCAVMAAGMGVLGLLLHIGITSTAAQAVAVASLLLFIAGFAMSAGPLVWILCSEIQPQQGRDFGIAVSTFVNWAANMVVAATFLSLLSSLGESNTFLLYAILNIAFGVAVFLYVPETRGVSLERLGRNLLAGKRLRDLGKID